MPERPVDMVLREFSKTPCTGYFCTTTRCSCAEIAMAEEIVKLRDELAKHDPNKDEYRVIGDYSGGLAPDDDSGLGAFTPTESE